MMRSVESFESVNTLETIETVDTVEIIEPENMDSLFVLLVAFLFEPIFMFLLLLFVWAMSEFLG